MSDIAAAAAAVTIEEWRPDRATEAAIARDVDMLADVLHAVVHGGAGVSFILPFGLDDARAFWTDAVLPGVTTRRRRMLVARLDGRIVGTVQLDPAWAPNQPHRAEIAKLMVHRRARGSGIGQELMRGVEEAARDAGFLLLTLDAKRGGAAERLYRRMGWIHAGTIPRFAMDGDGRTPHDAVIFYKDLSDHAGD